jgi:hypothetical protein
MKPAMPRPRINLDTFRDEIERRIVDKHTQNQIRRWLASQGVAVSENTLSARCLEWEATRRTKTALVAAGSASFRLTKVQQTPPAA